MNAVSTFGTAADFDRDFSLQISKVKSLERNSEVKSWIVSYAVNRLTSVMTSVVDFISKWAIARLLLKAQRMERSIAWFNDEYERFCRRVSQGALIAHPEFVRKVQKSRASTLRLAQVCRKNAHDLREMNMVNPRLIHAFETVASMCLGMDESLKRYEEIAYAAKSSEGAIRRSTELRADLNRIITDFSEDDPLMEDHQLDAAAKAAIARIQARTTVAAVVHT
ncbi:MAG: hypothetical protein V4614_01205 [Pseudomonadota bacterium]